jgi:beta-lactamase class A
MIDSHDVLSRRTMLAVSLLATARLVGQPAPGRRATTPDPRLVALERAHGGRLGVAILNTATGAQLLHREHERFPVLSTFKFLAAALVLSRVDAGREQLGRRVRYDRSALVTYSPLTEPHAGGEGMTLGDLCHAAVTASDNTAGNLLLESFGGPAGLTAFARSIGDGMTRLDRTEVALNEAIPGDPRDTTTPMAMLEDMRHLLLGDRLSAPSRAQLAEWLIGSTTGGTRLRAGLPAGWRVGDKTGTSPNGVTNDIAIAWPPRQAPVLISAYYAEAPIEQTARNAVLAEVGRIAGSIA